MPPELRGDQRRWGLPSRGMFTGEPREGRPGSGQHTGPREPRSRTALGTSRLKGQAEEETNRGGRGGKIQLVSREGRPRCPESQAAPTRPGASGLTKPSKVARSSSHSASSSALYSRGLCSAFSSQAGLRLSNSTLSLLLDEMEEWQQNTVHKLSSPQTLG